MKRRSVFACIFPGHLGFRGIASPWILTIALAIPFRTAAGQAKQDFKPDKRWLSTVQKSIEADEYRPSKQMVGLKGERLKEPKWHINNRAQGFRSAVSKEGWEIAPRPPAKNIDPKDPTKYLKEIVAKKDNGPKWHWRYRFSAVSRGSERTKLPAPEVRDENEAVLLQYSRSVSEWYKNSRAGIEQGFELKEKPHLKGKGELVLVGEVETDLVALTQTREKIGFSKSGAEVVQFTGLKALDAAGRTLPSWLSYSGKGKTNQLLIHIDDSEAVYPVVVDPLATSAAWTSEVNQADAFYGYSVATAGDVNGDGFSDVLVGAWAYSNGENEEGRVYLYAGSAAGLSTSASWVSESDSAGARFGWSVSTAGDVNGDGFSDVLVGQPNSALRGRVYLFLGSGSGLSTSAWMTESDQDGSYYGFSVSSAGDVNADGFSDIIVGAWTYDEPEDNEGKAFLFLGSATGPSLNPDWTAQSNQNFGYFGYSVSSAGDIDGDGYSDVLVGAWGMSNGESMEGQAYLYRGSASGLATAAAWIGESDQTNAYYGDKVSSAGDVNGDGFSDVLIGAWSFDSVNEGWESVGKAFLYFGSVGGLSTQVGWSKEGDQDGAHFGDSVATAGDLNADGYGDILVGASRFDNGESDEGQAYLFLGGSAGPSTTPAWTGESNQAVAYYGAAVASAGDVNGDGAPDVLVGSYYFDSGENDEGKAFLYLGIPPVATPTTAPPIATPTISIPTNTPIVDPVIPELAPVPISPKSSVPAPAVEVSNKTVTVIIPELVLSLTQAQIASLIKTLVVKDKLSKAKATALVNNSANFTVTYTITIAPALGAASAVSLDASFEISASADKKRQYKSRLNRVSIKNLPAGNYTASYLGEIALKRPKRIVGSTKKSAPTKFKFG